MFINCGANNTDENILNLRIWWETESCQITCLCLLFFTIPDPTLLRNPFKCIVLWCIFLLIYRSYIYYYIYFIHCSVLKSMKYIGRPCKMQVYLWNCLSGYPCFSHFGLSTSLGNLALSFNLRVPVRDRFMSQWRLAIWCSIFHLKCL